MLAVGLALSAPHALDNYRRECSGAGMKLVIRTLNRAPSTSFRPGMRAPPPVV